MGESAELFYSIFNSRIVAMSIYGLELEYENIRIIGRMKKRQEFIYF